MEGFTWETWLIVFGPMPVIMLLVTINYGWVKLKRKYKHG